MTDLTKQTVEELRNSGHLVIIWTPEEIGDADLDDLESVSIERGHAYLESFGEPENDN